jgi:hypothetical protein
MLNCDVSYLNRPVQVKINGNFAQNTYEFLIYVKIGRSTEIDISTGL